MRLAYQPLFRIRLRHAYYTDGISRNDFSLVPTPACRTLLDQYGLVFRPGADGGALYASVEPDSSPATLLKPLGDDNLRLAFLLTPLQPQVLNMTHLPRHKPRREVFYFDNLRDDQTNGRLHLSDSIADARLGAPLRLLTAPAYSYRFDPPVNAATLNLTDRFANPVHTVSFRLPKPDDLISEYRLDLSGVSKLTAGRYHLSDDHGGGEDFYYDPGLFGHDVLGIMEIFSRTDRLTPDQSNRVPNAYCFLDGAALTGLDAYTLQFERRATIWRYVVTKQYPANDITLDGLTVTGPVTFTKTTTGERALFTSVDPVPFQQTPRGIVLQHDGTKLRDLPNPSPTAPLQAHGNGAGLLSAVYASV